MLESTHPVTMRTPAGELVECLSKRFTVIEVQLPIWRVEGQLKTRVTWCHSSETLLCLLVISDRIADCPAPQVDIPSSSSAYHSRAMIGC